MRDLKLWYLPDPFKFTDFTQRNRKHNIHHHHILLKQQQPRSTNEYTTLINKGEYVEDTINSSDRSVHMFQDQLREYASQYKAHVEGDNRGEYGVRNKFRSMGKLKKKQKLRSVGLKRVRVSTTTTSKLPSSTLSSSGSTTTRSKEGDDVLQSIVAGRYSSRREKTKNK
jgi:hypothetical protein